MKPIGKAAIIGVGVMGGSIALALKDKFPKTFLTGYARSARSYRRLRKLNFLDRIERDLKKAVKRADLIVLALPVYAIVEYCKKISPFLKKGAVVFDLGSSKEVIEKSVRRFLPKDVAFVGCHPLCGSEKSGAQFSQKKLFQGNFCFVTSPPRKKATLFIGRLWRKLGSKVVFVSPSAHDRIISFLSHFPHILSFSLASSLPRGYLKFSPPGLKDMTRIANSPPQVWTDILLSNKKNILREMKGFVKILRQFKEALAEDNAQKVFKLIKKANDKCRRQFRGCLR